jgi:amphiphysin
MLSFYLFLESRKWKDFKVKGRQPEPRSFHSTTAVGNKVVVMGGRGKPEENH